MPLKPRYHSERHNRVSHGSTLVRTVAARFGGGAHRGGFSLNEIMIAIFVMAIGLVGVFSLFPIGLLKVSQAVNLSQSVDMGRSALADMRVQGLLNPDRYRVGSTAYPVPNNPFVQDWGNYKRDRDTFVSPSGDEEKFEEAFYGYLRRYPGEPGLPVCVDPEFIHHYWEEREDLGFDWQDRFPVPRLGQLLDPDPMVAPEMKQVMMHGMGMQRVIPTDAIDNDNDQYALTDAWVDGTVHRRWPDSGERYLYAGSIHQIFGSRNGLLFRDDRSDIPVVDGHGQVLTQHKFSWMATAQLLDAGDEHSYHVSIVTFSNRDLAGEQVVAAIYLPRSDDLRQSSNQIVLDWPFETVGIEIPRDAWLLDATYSRPDLPTAAVAKHTRAHWYKIVDRGEPYQVEVFGGGGGYRNRRLLTVDRPVHAVTPLDTGGSWGIAAAPSGGLYHVAVIIPGVVSVYEKTVTVP